MKRITKNIPLKIYDIFNDNIRPVTIDENDTVYFYGGRPGLIYIPLENGYGRIFGYRTFEEAKNHIMENLENDLLKLLDEMEKLDKRME